MPVRHVILLFLGHAAVCPSDMLFCCISKKLLYLGQLLYLVQVILLYLEQAVVSRTGCCTPVRQVILLYLGQSVVSRTAAVSLTSEFAVSWARHCCTSYMSFCFISERLLYLGQVIFLYLGQVTVSRTGHFCCVLDRLLCLPEVVVSRTGYSVVNRTCCSCCSSEASSAISRTGCRISDRLPYLGQPYLGQVAVSRTGCCVSDNPSPLRPKAVIILGSFAKNKFFFICFCPKLR